MSPDWHLDANCRDYDTDDFFPISTTNEDPYHLRRLVCQPCPVRQQCLTDIMRYEATATGGRHGIFGGLTPTQRAAMARQQRRSRTQ